MRAKTYNVGELVLRLPEKKMDKLKPKWEAPFIIDEVSLEGRTVFVMHQAIASSRTPGTRPDSEDSMPSVGLFVRFLLPIVSNTFSSLFAFFLFLGLKLFARLNRAPVTYTYSNMYVRYAWELL